MERRKRTWQEWCMMALALYGLIAILVNLNFENKLLQSTGMFAVAVALMWMNINRFYEKRKGAK